MFGLTGNYRKMAICMLVIMGCLIAEGIVIGIDFNYPNLIPHTTLTIIIDFIIIAAALAVIAMIKIAYGEIEANRPKNKE